MVGKKRRRRAVFGLLGALVCVCLIGACVYLGGYYRADDVAKAALVSDDVVAVHQEPDLYYSMAPMLMLRTRVVWCFILERTSSSRPMRLCFTPSLLMAGRWCWSECHLIMHL